MHHRPFPVSPEGMSNAELIIAAHVCLLPEPSAEHFGALVDDAALAIASVNHVTDAYRREVDQRLRDGRMDPLEHRAIYERVVEARLAADEGLRRRGMVTI